MKKTTIALAAALTFLSACAQVPQSTDSVNELLALKKLTISRPTNESFYLVSYDIAGYGMGQLRVAGNSTAKEQVCTDYVAGAHMITLNSGALQTAMENKSICHGVVVIAEILTGDVVKMRFDVLRLNSLKPVHLNGMEVLLPATSNLNLSHEFRLPPGHAMAIDGTSVSITPM